MEKVTSLPLRERPLLVDHLKRIAEATTKLMGKNCEVAIHDFSNLDDSLFYLCGSITGRKIGSPVSTRLFMLLRKYGDSISDQFNYRIRTKGGSIIRSSTTFIRDEYNHVIGCYCINYDVTNLLNVREILNEFAQFSTDSTPSAMSIPETSMEKFVDGIIEQAIIGIGKQVAFMHKSERLEVVRMLDRHGAFKLRGSVEYVAKILGVSRFTVYNYINENNKMQC